MNRTYRLVFNKALGLVQVVSELANCRGKKSSGRSTVSVAHTGFSENLSAQFKLKAISIAATLTVTSLLTIASPSSFAEPIDNTSGNISTLTTTVGITGGSGTNGASGYNGDDGGSGVNGINNTTGTIGILTNNVAITGGAGGAGGNGYDGGGNGGGGNGGGGIFNDDGTITTLNNNINGSITGGNGGQEGTGYSTNGAGGGDGGAGFYNVYGTLTNLNNTGSITGGAGGAGTLATGGRGGVGIENSYGTLTNLNNTGSITGGAAGGNVGAGYGGRGADAISNYQGTITNLTNNGSITGSAGGAGRSGYSPGAGLGGGRGIDNYYGTIATLNNNGSITGGAGGVGGSAADGGDRAGSGAGGSNAIENGYSTITTLNNNGSITGGAGGDEGIGTYGNGAAGRGGKGMNNGYYTTLTTLNNNGSITGGNGGAGRAAGGRGGNGGVGLYGYATITTLNNFGSITGGSGGAGVGIDNNGSNGFGIENLGSIEMLNNAQGGDGLTPAKTALTYRYNLPTNYNIIINSLSHYGQIAFSNPDDTTTFGISSLSGSNIGVAGTRYQNVISGLSSTDITNTAETLNYQNGNLSATYQLVADDLNVANTWDLLILSMISGPSATDTQASLHSLAPKLRGAFSRQSIATNFANMNTYDCDLFDAKGVCVSVGGQQTYVDNPSGNMTSTVVVAGYKVSPNIRIGGFLNQNINNNTVSGVHISNANPLMGVFAVWNQKEDRLGYQVKIANAYQDKDVTTTRDVIDSAEAGTGRTNLNTQSYVGELSYAFLANEEKTLVRPYAALRYTRIKQDGYTEQTSAGVTAPLTYAGLADRSTTALVGVKLNHKLAEKVNLTGSLGIEQDLHHQVDNLTATGIAGLTSEHFNDSIKRTRPVASIGAYYMPVKNQRISADIYYQQLPFQSTGAATAYVNYTIGF
jgi:hypothetical protein